MQNDYIMRMLEQVVQAILSVIQRRKAGDYKEARKFVLNAAKSFLRIDFDLLLFYDPDTILEHFEDFTNQLETEKCVLGADLLYELALIEKAEQNLALELRFKLLCLYLYTTGLPKEPQFQTALYFEKVNALIGELKKQLFSEKITRSVHAYEQFVALQIKV